MKKKTILVAILVLVLSLCFTFPAFAAEINDPTDYYTEKLEEDFSKIYQSLKKIAACGAAVGLGACIISYIIGDETKAKKAVASAGFVCLAFFGILLLGLVTDFGASILEDLGLPKWTPYSPTVI